MNLLQRPTQARYCHCIGALGGKKPELRPQDLLLAVDGGYTYCKNWGLTPDLTVGDFDSLGYVPQERRLHHLPCRKDDTDMAYAVAQGRFLGGTGFFLQGGLGARLDHSLANLHLLYDLAQRGLWGMLLGEGQCATVLQQGRMVFPVQSEGYCSVFAQGGVASGITLKGLSYEGEELELSPKVPLGVSNEFLPGKTAEISVTEGAVLIVWQIEALWSGEDSALWDYLRAVEIEQLIEPEEEEEL